MKLPTLIITIMSATLSNNLMQRTKIDQLVFEALNCRNPNKIVSFLTKDWCQPTKSSGNALGEKKTVTILQDAKFQIVSGVRCTNKYRDFLYIVDRIPT